MSMSHLSLSRAFNCRSTLPKEGFSVSGFRTRGLLFKRLNPMAPKPFGDAGLEPTWAKLLTPPGQILTSVVTILLLRSDGTQWTDSGRLY